MVVRGSVQMQGAAKRTVQRHEASVDQLKAGIHDLTLHDLIGQVAELRAEPRSGGSHDGAQPHVRSTHAHGTVLTSVLQKGALEVELGAHVGDAEATQRKKRGETSEPHRSESKRISLRGGAQLERYDQRRALEPARCAIALTAGWRGASSQRRACCAVAGGV